MKRMKPVVSILIALVIAGVLAACGSQAPEPAPAGSGSQTGGDVSTDRKASNSVVVGISQELDSLDPHNAEYAGTREVLFNIFEGLVKATPEGEIEPAVASEYEISEDATKITFTLRDGITFHDGTPVTAEDVKYSIERYAGIQGEESAFSIIKEIVIADENKIEVVLNEASSEFVYELTCAILPQANDANITTNPIGTGPFKVASYVPGEDLVVEKYDGYWKSGFPYLDEVDFKVVTDAKMAVNYLNAGTIDIYQYLTADQAATVSSDYNILEGSVNYVQGMFLNNAVKPFDDIRVRQAIYYAVDRDMINEMIFGGKSHIIGTNMIPASKKYYNADTEKTYTHDVEKAKELLKEAGYPDGFSFTITVPNNYAPHESTANIIAENLAEVGIKADIQLVEFNTWFADVYVDRKYEATVVAVDGRLAPSTFFEKNVTGAANNFTNYSNPDFDAVYGQATSELDPDKKVAHYKELQQILADDAASIYVQDPSNLVAVNSQLTGYVFYPISAQDMSVVKYK
ncbi:MAG: ABC transporter substrate-binding protein [Parasporobacterium sp.]|nr:ABC transporter substrate-binding protein [Parasporobacterium sp.]